MAHGEAYVAQSTPAHLNHFLRAIMEANTYRVRQSIIAYTPCQPEHGIGDDASTRQAKLAVESRTFPLFTYDPRRGPTSPSGCRSRATRRFARTGPVVRTEPRSTSWRSPGQRAGSRRTSPPTARPRPRSSPPQADRLAAWRDLQSWVLAGRPDDGSSCVLASRRRPDVARRMKPATTPPALLYDPGAEAPTHGPRVGRGRRD